MNEASPLVRPDPADPQGLNDTSRPAPAPLPAAAETPPAAPFRPVPLEGRLVRLEPLTLEHADGLRAAVEDGRRWELWYTDVPTPDGMGAEIRRRLAWQEEGTMAPFAVRRLSDGALIGIQAVVLNNAKIGRNCVVGAGAVVTEGKEFPDNSLIVGAPARAIRTLDEAAIAGFAQLAPHYVENARLHGTRMKKIG